MLTYYINQSIEQIHWHVLARENSCGLFESRQFQITNLEQLAKRYMEPNNPTIRDFNNSNYRPWPSHNQCKIFPFGLMR
jgi:diadenosine tetraphosphate (Ap4A) HIT family hydrolase